MISVRRMSLSNLNFENSTVVASALVAEIRQTRPGSNPGARYGRAGSNPAERTQVGVDSLAFTLEFRVRVPGGPPATRAVS